MNISTPDIPGELRAAAARQRISQIDLANRLGVNRVWVHRRLSGAVSINVDDLVRICAVLDLDPRELLPAPPAAAV